MKGHIFPLFGPYKESKSSLREMALLIKSDYIKYPSALYEAYDTLIKNIFDWSSMDQKICSCSFKRNAWTDTWKVWWKRSNSWGECDLKRRRTY